MNQIVNLNAPTHVELTITERCNHHCLHCYNTYRIHGGDQQSITQSQADIILDQFVACGVGYVTLTGGEPLMEQEMLLYLVRRLRKNNIGVGLNTNLSLMTATFLEELKAAGFENTVLTSLPGFTSQSCDAITQVQGSFDRILRGIQLCRNAGIRVCINAVFTQQNLHRGNELLQWLRKFPVDGVAVTKVVPPSYQRDHSDYLFSKTDVQLLVDLMRRIREETACSVTSLCAIPWCLADDLGQFKDLSTKCAAGIVGCAVDAISGAITPCAHNETSYGSIYDETLDAIWKRMSAFRDPMSLPSACRECALLYKCGGECRLTAARITTPKYALSPIDKASTPKIVDRTTNNLIDLKHVFKIPAFVRTRSERFGGTLIHGNHEIYVKSGLYQLFLTLQARESFTVSDIKVLVEMNEAFYKIFQILIDYGFIEIVS